MPEEGKMLVGEGLKLCGSVWVAFFGGGGGSAGGLDGWAAGRFGWHVNTAG